MTTTILQTQRITLLPFKAEDLSLFHQLNIDPFIRKYLWDDEIIPLNLSKEILQTNERYFKERNYGLWKIILKASNEVIGYTGLWFFFEEPQPQLIYAIQEAHTGKGLATEAAKTIIDYTFNELKFDYLIAATDEPHLSSQKVAQRLGMHLSEKRLENDKPTLFYRIERNKT